MEIVLDIFRNHVLLTGLAAWVTAQVLKGIIYAVMNRGFDVKRMLGDGGMPSGHSATVTAVAVSCGLSFGLDSALFGLAMILAIITCHDAMHARNQIGKQAALLNELFEHREEPPSLEEFVGHTPLQVLAGILLGLIVGLFMNLVVW